jgi:hypothetical protein
LRLFLAWLGGIFASLPSNLSAGDDRRSAPCSIAVVMILQQLARTPEAHPLDGSFPFRSEQAMRTIRRLADYPWVRVRLDCAVCKRSGTYRLARLAAKYGSEILLDHLVARISADCAWRDDPRGSGCGAYLSDLPPRRPPDMPARAMRVIAGGKQ